MSQYFLPWAQLRRLFKLSERSFAVAAHLSRGAVRQIEDLTQSNVTLRSLESAASVFSREVQILITSPDAVLHNSTVAVSARVVGEGFDTWKLHFFELVDEYRRTLDARLILLPPCENLAPCLTALLAAIVRDLCSESAVTPPEWAMKRRFLDKPWFVSGIQSLKASALLESPLSYRMSNIFVQQNFLQRA